MWDRVRIQKDKDHRPGKGVAQAEGPLVSTALSGPTSLKSRSPSMPRVRASTNQNLLSVARPSNWLLGLSVRYAFDIPRNDRRFIELRRNLLRHRSRQLGISRTR